MLKAIKRLAIEKNVRLYEIEQECGLTSGAIHHWDTSTPAYDKVVRVARFLGVSVEDLYDSDKNDDSGMNKLDYSHELSEIRNSLQRIESTLEQIEKLLEANLNPIKISAKGENDGRNSCRKR